MKMKYAVMSCIGLRKNNEDAFRVMDLPEYDCWAGLVCDGMGGHECGEVASETVIDSFTAFWNAHIHEEDTEDKVLRACREAAVALQEKSERMGHIEMGTTLVLASIRKNVLTVAHVGDSRCYLVRPHFGLLYRTQDHTGLHQGWEMITRCFFSDHPEIAVPDVLQWQIRPGDRILLCSDGVYKSFRSDICRELLSADSSPSEMIDTLRIVCQEYAHDNYTAVLAFAEE